MGAASLRNLDGLDDLGDHLIGGQAFKVGFGLEQDAMAKDGQRGGFDVVWQEIVATLHSGESARDEENADGGTETAT
jgi:hypothetical protein